ncbi:MAG: thiamine pyrophosphate-binding protein, partial [Candidatus Omnitrophica bacterium]|nr:thiamine pyrophosphate-binding protein [Candidatus Omnitrophota bacterium]
MSRIKAVALNEVETGRMIKLSDYIMNFLVAKGVRHVFMLPGGGAMHLDDSLGRCAALEYTCFLHEQALAIAAEAYGQYTNSPGVGLVTSGPGSTNTITGVAAAYIDSTPCVFLSGQAKRSDLKGSSGVRQMGSQEVDIVSMVSCITKYAVTVLEPYEIRYHLEKA